MVVCVNGIGKSMSAWARDIGVSRQALWAQVAYMGKTPEKAVMDYLEKKRLGLVGKRKGE